MSISTTPATDSWSRLPDLPVGVNHAAAASAGGKLYVVGGYGGPGREAALGVRLRRRPLARSARRCPAERGAAGAAIVGRKLYVVGGVGPNGLARRAFALDLKTGRWSSIPGPTPREHLAVTAPCGKVYAVAGRLAGVDTNLRAFESYSPATKRWRELPPVPEPRGGTGAAFAKGLIVSVGGEEPKGTIGSVYGFDVTRGAGVASPDLPTPRHGLGVAAVAGRVYVDRRRHGARAHRQRRERVARAAVGRRRGALRLLLRLLVARGGEVGRVVGLADVERPELELRDAPADLAARRRRRDRPGARSSSRSSTPRSAPRTACPSSCPRCARRCSRRRRPPCSPFAARGPRCRS